jgi:Zn-dependent peptidase ImmA (M78 family)
MQSKPGETIDYVLQNASDDLKEKIILEKMWDEVSSAGYFGAIVEIAKRLNLSKEGLVAAAHDLGRKRAGLVYTFCKTFNMEKESVKEILQDIKSRLEQKEKVLTEEQKMTLGSPVGFIQEIEKDLKDLDK